MMIGGGAPWQVWQRSQGGVVLPVFARLPGPRDRGAAEPLPVHVRARGPGLSVYAAQVNYTARSVGGG
jgi:hypothetical protein